MARTQIPKDHWSTWYEGTKTDWQNLTEEEREDRSFEATSCLFAYPTWPAGERACIHTACRIIRGELPLIASTNGTLRYEAREGWLRFCSRDQKARIFRAVRAVARQTGNYDPWRNGCWRLMVGAGILG